MKFCSQKLKSRILATFGFNRTTLRATQPKANSYMNLTYMSSYMNSPWIWHIWIHIWIRLHTAEATFDVLRPIFEDRVISSRADVVWPARGYVLTPLDYYLWGGVRDKCYTDKPETIAALKHNCREAIGEIQLHTIDNVLKNWTDRVGYCMASRGSNLNEIPFPLLTRRIVLLNKNRNLR